MKEKLYHLFVWFAGSDTDILVRCGQSERIKHAGYGGLVLVPAILGVISMAYAMSTLTPSVYTYIGAGLTWGFIVFLFDRFIVSTFRKSPSLWKDILSLVFLVRIVFAVGIGIIVSHPLVLLVFNDSLVQELTNMQIDGEQEINDKYTLSLQEIQHQDSLLKAEIDKKLETRACKENLLLFEMSGKDTTMFCGTTSGMKQYGPRSQEIKEEIKTINAEIQELRSKNFTTMASNASQTDSIRQTKANRLTEFRANFSSNYLAREIALERLERREIGGITIKYTKWFILIFFILVDLLPVTFKALTKYGEYDKYLSDEDNIDIHPSNAYARNKSNEVRKLQIDKVIDDLKAKMEKE